LLEKLKKEIIEHDAGFEANQRGAETDLFERVL
jgi:hypothetical protein